MLHYLKCLVETQLSHYMYRLSSRFHCSSYNSVTGADSFRSFQHIGKSITCTTVHCPSPMYADDLALIADSPEGLQKLLDIVSHYTSTWHYEINSSKSAVMVFGESTRSRTSGRQSRSFSVCSEIIQEVDSYKHLGVLRL